MPIPFNCPHCGVTGKAPDKLAGRLVECPKCKGPVEVASIDWANPPPSPLAPSPTPQRVKWRIPRRVWPPLMIILGIAILLVGIVGEVFWWNGGFYTPVAIVGVSFLIILVAPASLAFWQVRTPRRGPVPLYHVATMAEWSILLLAGAVFAGSMHQDVDGIPWANRIALAFALWAVMAKIARSTFGRKSWRVLVPVMLVMIFVWSRFDYRELHWKNEKDPPEERWDYTDYVYRSHEYPFYRKMHRFGGKDDTYISISTSGPMSETGKLHGQWKTSIWRKIENPNSLDEVFDHSEQWYWYGEPITEGDWHLRNR